MRTNDAALARRQGFVNIAATVAVISSVFHVVEQTLMGIADLWPLAIHNAVMALLFAATPLFHRIGRNAAACWLIATIIVGTLNVIRLIGLDGGAQVYFTVVAASFLFFGLSGWRWYALCVATTVLVTAAAYAFAPALGPVGMLRPDYAAHLSLSTVFAAIAVNTWLFTVALTDTWRAEARAAYEADRSETLLHAILPAPVAEQLKAAPGKGIAEHHPEATILFADIAGFTSAARTTPPDVLVAWLDEWVKTVDSLAEDHGVEKIKTIGDAYMAVAGLRGCAAEGAAQIARFAIAMQESAARQRHLASAAAALPVRIGIHTGPVVAGVIGGSRFAYDLWGDTVNIAARLESGGTPGKIQISPATAELLTGQGFTISVRGEVQIRGVGSMATLWLDAPTAAPG